RLAAAQSAATTSPARRKPIRLPRVILAPQKSLELRERLITELAIFSETEALTAWAQKILPQKDQLTTSDAEALEGAFAAKLSVPLCRTHHRELHQRGDERIWWQQLNIDPMLAASALWAQTHPALAQPASAINGAIDGRSIFDADPRLRAPNLHAP